MSTASRSTGGRWPARGPRLDVEPLSGPAGIASIEDEWRSLPSDSARPGICSDPRFVRAWAETLGEGAPLTLLCFRSDGRLVGVVPLVSRTLAAARGGRRLELPGSSDPSVSDLTAASVSPGFEVQVAAAMVDYLDHRRDDWDTLYLGNVAADSQVFSGVLGLIGARGWRHAVRALPGVVIDTGRGDFDDYAKRVDRYKRLKRRWPQLQRMGDASIELGLTGDAGAGALDQLMELHRLRWAPDSILDDPSYCDFLMRLYRAFDETGQAIVTTLKLGDEMLHVTLVFRVGDCEQWLLTAATPADEHRAISPGALHESMMIRHAFESDVRRAYLLRTVIPAKLRWASELDYELALRIESPGASRRVGLGLVANESAVLGRVGDDSLGVAAAARRTGEAVVSAGNKALDVAGFRRKS